jgi:5-formyltetrahydrofolate cyclo-ligase
MKDRGPNISKNEISDERHAIRREQREWRRELDADSLGGASRNAALQLGRLGQIHVDIVALFSPFDGEIDPMPAAQMFSPRARYALPTVAGDDLRFREFTPTTVLLPNQYGISEPAAGDTIAARDIGLFFVPAVAVSLAGDRLGFGAGFYDRLLAQFPGPESRPLTITVIHDHAVLERIPTQPWDIPIDVIVTPTRLIQPRPIRSGIIPSQERN